MGSKEETGSRGAGGAEISTAEGNGSDLPELLWLQDDRGSIGNRCCSCLLKKDNGLDVNDSKKGR